MKGIGKMTKREGKGIIYYNNGDKKIGDYLNSEPVGMYVILHSNVQITVNEY